MWHQFFLVSNRKFNHSRFNIRLLSFPHNNSDFCCWLFYYIFVHDIKCPPLWVCPCMRNLFMDFFYVFYLLPPQKWSLWFLLLIKLILFSSLDFSKWFIVKYHFFSIKICKKNLMMIVAIVIEMSQCFLLT